MAGSLFDIWAHMGPKYRNLPYDSRAGLFSRESLPEFHVEKLAPAFHDGFARPTEKLVGQEWVKTVQGTLSLENLNLGFLWKAGIGKIPGVPLRCLGWKRIAEKTKAFFESLRRR